MTRASWSGEATAGSVLRAPCGEGAPQAPARPIRPFRANSPPARGSGSQGASAECPEARRAPQAGSRDARPCSARLPGSSLRPSASYPPPHSLLTSCLGRSVRPERRALVSAGEVSDHHLGTCSLRAPLSSARWAEPAVPAGRGGAGQGGALPLAGHPGKCSPERGGAGGLPGSLSSLLSSLPPPRFCPLSITRYPCLAP